MRFTVTFSLVLTSFAALGAGAPWSPSMVASEDNSLAKRPNYKMVYRANADEADASSLAKRPNFKMVYRANVDEADASSLAKRPNFKYVYRGNADEAATSSLDNGDAHEAA